MKLTKIDVVVIQILQFLLCLEASLDVQHHIDITQTTATLSEARVFFAATSSGELVFFAGGSSTALTSPSDRVDICDVTSGMWTTATLSVPRANLAATSSGALVFFGGGWNGSSSLYNQVDIYNMSDGSWSTATLSQARCCLAATSVGSLVLFGGGSGYNLTYSNVVDIYNVSLNTWTTATLSNNRAWLAATSVANRYAIFAGGLVWTTYFDTVDIYDSQSEIWSTATLSRARGDLAATSLGNLAFFGGGTYNISQVFNVVDIFNATSLTWSTANLSQARFYLAAASLGDTVAFGGGSPDGFTMSAVVDMYNVTSDLWYTATLSQPRAGLAATSSTNKLFFGGGLSNTGPSNIVDIFEIASPLPLSPPQTSTIASVSSSSSGAIAAIVVSILLVVIGVGVVVSIVVLRKRRRANSETQVPRKQNSNIETSRQPSGSLISTETLRSQRKSQIPFKELVIEREVEESASRKLYLGKWNGAPVLLKYVREQVEFDKLMSEIKVIIALPPHPNIVQTFGISLDGPQPAIIMEYCAGGTLDKLLFSQNNLPLTTERKLELVSGIARGLLHLHKHNIIHRNLAARNVLLTDTGVPKISEFGKARILQNSDNAKAQADIGPVCWMAPESIATRNYTKQTDVWSFGIVVYEIVAQREPHSEMNIFEVAVSIRDKGLTPKIPDNCPPKLRTLMEMCWKKDPKERPTMDTVCAILR